MKAVIIAEDQVEEVVEFNSDVEYFAYSNGLSRGAELYGAGGCGIYDEQEILENFLDEPWAQPALEKLRK